MKSYQPTAEFRQLIDRLLDAGPLSRADNARLEELLEDDRALDYYISITQQEAILGAVLAENRPSAAARPPATAFGRLRVVWRMGLAAAVVFGAGFWCAHELRHDSPMPQDAPAQAVTSARRAARITGMMGVVWNDGSEPDLIAVGAVANRIAFQSGLLELTYSSGVRVTLEGPADFQVVDPQSGRLADGRMVASVPHGAEGFQVDYAHGKVVDLGTEFGLSARRDGSAQIGVFAGKVELHLPGAKPVPIFGNQAMLHNPRAKTELAAVPFDSEKFVRALPSREFRFKLNSSGTVDLSFDVSHLVRKASHYRVIAKWLVGIDAIRVRRMELSCDGKAVVADEHDGVTGYYDLVRDNLYRLDVPAEGFRNGRWVLRMTMDSLPRSHPNAAPVASDGVLLFEEGLVSEATEKDFTGRWGYRFEGHHWVREFRADGSSSIFMDGDLIEDSFVGSRWSVKDGVMRVTLPERNAYDEHVLRDRNTLIFKCQPYENARRENSR